MTIFNPTKFVTRSLMGAVGLSAIALFGVAESAKAVDIQLGTDYFESPAGGSSFLFDLNMNGEIDLPDEVVPLQGLPIEPRFLENTSIDTVVQRLEDCTFVGGECLISIEMTQLSLETIEPVTINGFEYDVFTTLDPDQKTTGKMLIRDDGTFDSFLEVFYKAEFTAINDDAPEIDDFFDSFQQVDPTNMIPANATGALVQLNSEWGHTPIPGITDLVYARDPQLANCHGDIDLLTCASNDFFAVGSVPHEKGSPTFPEGHTTVTSDDGIVANIPTIPEPSTTLGLLFLGL